MSSSNNYANYYESDYQTSIEKAILAEDVVFSTIDNVQGKFYLPVMMPNSDTSKPTVKSNAARTTSNYITLNIPAYLLLPYMMTNITEYRTKPKTYMFTMYSNSFTIPKGTVFLVSYLGGEFTIEKTCIVGILTTA